MNTKLKPIVQQVVVVVGATSGIGLETARQFARRGARLVLAGRGQADLDATLAEVRQEGAEGITVEADVADWEQVNNIARQAVEAYGRIDTWAHVAGVSFYARLEDTTPEEFRRVIDVNLNGPAYGVMAALPHLKTEGRGSIVIVSSVDARIPLPYQGAYVAAKHGLDGMIDTLRMELKREDIPISITNILPATISTPFYDKARTKIGVKPGMLPPIYSAKSVADAIVYAAEHPVREINVGSSSVTYQMMHRLSRPLFDRVVGWTFAAQRTDIPRTVQWPNHLFEHLEGHHSVEGDEKGMYSKYTWLQLHPKTRNLLMALLLAIPTGLIINRNLHSRQNKRQPWFARLAEVAGIGALLASQRPKPSLTRKITSAAREMLPENMFGRRRQSFPQKVVTKAQDIFPKGISLPHETVPDKVTKQAKEIMPWPFRRREQTFPQRVASRAGTLVSDIRENVEERASTSRR